MGIRSIEEIKIMLRKFISLPIRKRSQTGIKPNQTITKYEKNYQNLKKWITKFGKFDNLDDEIFQLMKNQF